MTYDDALKMARGIESNAENDLEVVEILLPVILSRIDEIEPSYKGSKRHLMLKKLKSTLTRFNAHTGRWSRGK